MKTEATTNPIASESCTPKWRWGISVLIIVHLLAIFAEPLRFFSRSDVRPASPEFGLLRDTFARYVEWMYLDHGYFFFAPNPGPSHIVEYTIASPTEESPSTPIRFPDHKRLWPRLLNHRYFMLSEFYDSRFAPSDFPAAEKDNAAFQERWRFDRGVYTSLQDSIARSLAKKHGGAKVTIRRLERQLPDDDQVLLQGWTLDDPRLVQLLPESLAEMEAAASPPKAPAVEELAEPVR